MQPARSPSREEEAPQGTLTLHTQAVERAIQVMHTHIQERLTLEDLASVAYLSPYHFNRTFHRLVGVPPGEFLSALRFQMARRLLLTTSLKVIDICFTVGYTSTGSFTSRFTQMVGLSPRLLRQRAHEFELTGGEHTEIYPIPSTGRKMNNSLIGHISASPTFRGTIYIGLFSSPVPQGAPVRCTRLYLPGTYRLSDVADGVYYLRAAAFPVASDPQSYFLPGENILLGNHTSPLVIRHGHVFGDTDLVLHSPRLTDPPLVMGLPLL